MAALALSEEVLQDFLSAAGVAIRRHAIGFIGSSLGHEKVPLEVVEWFMALWDAYWTSHGRSDAADDPGAVLLGSWFASGEFPDDWALSSLYEWEIRTDQSQHCGLSHQAGLAPRLDGARCALRCRGHPDQRSEQPE